MLDARRAGEEEDDVSSIPDDRLRLFFTCCHPALAPEAQVALTLRTLGGLSTPEVARAFLVAEPHDGTAARPRQAQDPRRRGIPYAVPADSDLPDRLRSVLAALYLIFNEGYLATSADTLVRRELCDEAIRLARVLTALMPDEPEALGVLALMLLHHSRRDARAGRARATWCCWRTRTARAGTHDEIARGRRAGRSGRARRAPTRCRPRSPPSTRRAAPTGRGWPRSTSCSSRCGRDRWWSSTARSAVAMRGGPGARPRAGGRARARRRPRRLPPPARHPRGPAAPARPRARRPRWPTGGRSSWRRTRVERALPRAPAGRARLAPDAHAAGARASSGCPRRRGPAGPRAPRGAGRAGAPAGARAARGVVSSTFIAHPLARARPAGARTSAGRSARRSAASPPTASAQASLQRP